VELRGVLSRAFGDEVHRRQVVAAGLQILDARSPDPHPGERTGQGGRQRRLQLTAPAVEGAQLSSAPSVNCRPRYATLAALGSTASMSRLTAAASISGYRLDPAPNSSDRPNRPGANWR
jgi:hypothetical protein